LVFVSEIHKAATLSQDHADPQTSRLIPPNSRRLLVRAGVFCACQELIHKSHMFCCLRLSQGETQWRETGWPPKDMCTVPCYSDYCGSEFMLIATERRETELF